MPNPNGGPGRPFKKGIAPNPKGSSALARSVGTARKFNHIKMLKILNKFIAMPVNDLIAFAQNKENAAIEVLVASILVYGIKNGDQTRLTFLLDRLIGKVKEVHEHSFTGNLNTVLVDKIAEIEKANRNGGHYNGEKSSTKEKDGEEAQEVKEI